MNGPLDIANTVDRTVESVMREVVVPMVLDRVDRIVEDRVYLAIKNMNPQAIERAIHDAVRHEIMPRIRVRIEVDE